MKLSAFRLAVADIREVNEFGDERVSSVDADAGTASDNQTSPRADPFKGEFNVSIGCNLRSLRAVQCPQADRQMQVDHSGDA